MNLLEENKDNLTAGGGSVAAVISGVGSYFSSTHKTLSWVMITIATIFLIGTVYVQMTRKTRTVWASHGLMVLAVLVLVVVGYSDLHKAPVTEPASRPPVIVQQGPSNTAPIETKGDNSPAIGAGSGNSINYAAPPEHTKKAKK